ncbi:hypothetical protein O6H91_13G005400 [Diphasiastrum complanatum]|uniref:Uncharacterized protein n=1 Tax=Diphasiastrum complanatum TaxID=34168 RepID=A0ACC2BRU3_DIPCM|nr:hypothetical protein O6H91_13G005400 [Diphasiastrum complanatum]
MEPAGASELLSANSQPRVTEVLLEFRAGKMMLQGAHVHADPRKGLLRVVKGDEGLIHFQWVDRGLNMVEDDQIVFPDEAVFEKVQQSTGRVYILKFIHDDRRFFFWMQEPELERDDQLCKDVNLHLNLPLEMDDDDVAEVSTELPVSRISDIPTTVEQSERNINMEMPASSSDLMVGDANKTVQLADLQRILTNLGQVYNSGGPSQSLLDTGPSFSEILRPDVVLPLLRNCQLEERLAPFLPEGVQTVEAIAELMQSPQFHQQLELFTHVLRTGQIDLSQFEIDPSTCDLTVASFLEAIEDQVTRRLESNSRKTESEDEEERLSREPEKKDKDGMDESL